MIVIRPNATNVTPEISVIFIPGSKISEKQRQTKAQKLIIVVIIVMHPFISFFFKH
tara:strand:- start:483 stop:650 length:168 start_codon:yes stop_codon:yes gene_type:complete